MDAADEALRALAAWLAMPLTPTLNVSIALWLLGGLIALRFNVTGWHRRRRLLEAAERLRLGPAELELARQRLEAEFVAMLVQLAFIAIGVLVATVPLPPPIPPPRLQPWQTLLTVPVLLTVQVVLAFESGRQRRYDARRMRHRSSPPTEAFPGDNEV